MGHGRRIRGRGTRLGVQFSSDGRLLCVRTTRATKAMADAGGPARGLCPITTWSACRHPREAACIALSAATQVIRQLHLHARSVAIVVDIDNTLLFSHGEDPHMVQCMHDLLHQCARIAQVHLVTARTHAPAVVAYTKMQLAAAGLGASVTAMWFCPEAERATWRHIAAFKRRTRQHIEQRLGQTVVLTIGDDWTDHTTDGAPATLLQHSKSGSFVMFRVANTHSHTMVGMLVPRAWA